MPPSHELICALAPDGSGRARKVAGLTTHEFARLVGVLVEHDKARSSQIQSGLSLSRIA